MHLFSHDITVAVGCVLKLHAKGTEPGIGLGSPAMKLVICILDNAANKSPVLLGSHTVGSFITQVFVFVAT